MRTSGSRATVRFRERYPVRLEGSSWPTVPVRAGGPPDRLESTLNSLSDL